MLPVPTRTTQLAFLGAALLVLSGILFAVAPLVVMGGSAMVALVLALAASMPVGRRVRRERLELAWWFDHGGPGGTGHPVVVPGAPFKIRCYLRNRGPRSLVVDRIEPIVGVSARVLAIPDGAVVVPPARRVEFGFTLEAPAVSRVVLHGATVEVRGALGLFRVPLFFPNPLTVKVLPRASAPRRAASIARQHLDERAGRSLVRRRGAGTEIRELREHVSGDPFKAIAWKATARAGKLMVRELESDLQRTRYVVLDVSGTMRGGPPGSRKLDHAIEGAAAIARIGLAQGDRVGLVVVDGRVLAHVPALDGPHHHLAIVDALLGATEVVDSDLTDLDEQEVVALVARYARRQDGIDVRVGSGRSRAYDVPALVAHVTRSLASDTSGTKEVVFAPDATSSLLRRFCRARALPIPYRPEPRDGTKAIGLAAALRAAGGRTRGARSVVVLSDLDGLDQPEPLLGALELVRAHRHEVTFLVPWGPSYRAPGTTGPSRDLHLVFSRMEEHRLLGMQKELGRRGARVLPMASGDLAHLLLASTRRRTRPLGARFAPPGGPTPITLRPPPPPSPLAAAEPGSRDGS